MDDGGRALIIAVGGLAVGAFVGFHLTCSAGDGDGGASTSTSWCPLLMMRGCPFAIFGRRSTRDGAPGGVSRGAGSSAATKEEYISRLGMIPHPEGGFFVETYRSGSAPMASKGQTDEAGAVMTTSPPRVPTPARNVMTSIYYMLTAESGGLQWWANNMSDHVHYHHAGGTLIYNIVLPDGSFQERRLGSNISAGDEPQLVVTGGSFKSARLEEGADFVVIGEGVAPGFDFRDFKFVSKAELVALNAEAYEMHQDLVKPDPESEFEHYYEK